MRTSSSTWRSTGLTRWSARHAGSKGINPSLAATSRREPRMIKAGTSGRADGSTAGQPRRLPARARLGRRPGHLELFRRRLEGRSRFPGRRGCLRRHRYPSARPSRLPKTAGRSGRSRLTAWRRMRRARWRAVAAFSAGQQWVDDEHWLQVRDGRLVKVHAATGPLAAVRGCEGAGQEPRPHPLARRRYGPVDCRRDVLRHGSDPPTASCSSMPRTSTTRRFDLATAVRLTNQPGREQWPKFSPDGKAVAFVRDFDLYAVDIASQSEHRLTTGGRDDLRHGHADWVVLTKRSSTAAGRRSGGAPTRSSLHSWNSTTLEYRFTRSSMTRAAPSEERKRPTIPSRASRIRRFASVS